VPHVGVLYECVLSRGVLGVGAHGVDVLGLSELGADVAGVDGFGWSVLGVCVLRMGAPGMDVVSRTQSAWVSLVLMCSA
jgi:hypothetical protein